MAEGDDGDGHHLGRQAERGRPARRRRGRAASSASSRGRGRGRPAAGSAPPGRPRRPWPCGRSAGCRRTPRRARARRRRRPWRRGRRRAGRRARGVAPRAPWRRPPTGAPSARRWRRAARRRARRRRRRAGCSPRWARGWPRSGSARRWRRRRRRGGTTGRPAGCAPRRRSRAGSRARSRRPMVPTAGRRAGPGADWAPPRRPRYLWRCTGPGPVPAMRNGGGIDGGGGQEADGGRRCRIARRRAQGDHRAADRQVQGGRGAGAGAAFRRRPAQHEPDLPQPRGGPAGRLRQHPGAADVALRHGVLGQVRRRSSRRTRRPATR